MLRSSKAFHTVRQADYCALVEHFSDSAFVYATYSEDRFKHIPWVFFKLLVTEAQATVFLVDFENHNVDFSTDLSKFAWVLNLLGPREVADVDKTVNTFFKFYKHTEVGEVANLSRVLAAHRILGFDSFPWIFLELLDTK